MFAHIQEWGTRPEPLSALSPRKSGGTEVGCSVSLVTKLETEGRLKKAGTGPGGAGRARAHGPPRPVPAAVTTQTRGEDAGRRQTLEG